jgi:hypothetical protein
MGIASLRNHRAAEQGTHFPHLESRRVGSFTRTTTGVSPRRLRRHGSEPARAFVPTCFTMAWMRPSSFGEDDAAE